MAFGEDWFLDVGWAGLGDPQRQVSRWGPRPTLLLPFRRSRVASGVCSLSQRSEAISAGARRRARTVFLSAVGLFDQDVRPPLVGGSSKDFRPRRASRRSSHRRKSTPPVRDRPQKRKGRFASALSRLCSSWPRSAVFACYYKYLRWGSTLKPDER
jgi:hypothetical protein